MQYWPSREMVTLTGTSVGGTSRRCYAFGEVLVMCVLGVHRVAHSGLHKLMIRHWRFGANEMWRSLNKRSQLKRIQRFIPSLELADLQS